MEKEIKRNLFLIIGNLLFFLHLLYSPFPSSSLKLLNYEINNLIMHLKIIKENKIINKNGKEYSILSWGFNAGEIRILIFSINGVKYPFEPKRGLNTIIIKNDKISNYNFDLHGSDEDALKFLNFLENIPDSSILFFAVSDEASCKWNDEIDKKWEKIGAKESLKDKYRWSYLFVIKKENGKIFPLYEKLSKDKAIFLKIKI
jgi:hypothetical protein